MVVLLIIQAPRLALDYLASLTFEGSMPERLANQCAIDVAHHCYGDHETCGEGFRVSGFRVRDVQGFRDSGIRNLWLRVDGQ